MADENLISTCQCQPCMPQMRKKETFDVRPLEQEMDAELMSDSISDQPRAIHKNLAVDMQPVSESLSLATDSKGIQKALRPTSHKW